MKVRRALIAEFIGTFFLCFAGIAAILGTMGGIGSGAGLVGIALAHGLALSVAVNMFSAVSGAHFNPAVTIAMMVTGRISPANAGLYTVVQIASAAIAAVACQAIFPESVVNAARLGIPLPAEWVSPGTLILTEFILTFMLVAAIFGTCVDPRGPALKIGGFGVGLTVAFNILAAGAVTGASMNPARSLGPALVHGHFDHHIFYWIAPIAGALTAALVYDHLILAKEEA
jgi:MIP family channel proteins